MCNLHKPSTPALPSVRSVPRKPCKSRATSVALRLTRGGGIHPPYDGEKAEERASCCVFFTVSRDTIAPILAKSGDVVGVSLHESVPNLLVSFSASATRRAVVRRGARSPFVVVRALLALADMGVLQAEPGALSYLLQYLRTGVVAPKQVAQ